MRVRIHRGAKEIGGNCIEVESGGKRIVLDVGRPLEAERDESVPLPAVPGLADGSDGRLLGLLISHGHQDHWGLVEQVSEKVPIYIGKGAAAVLKAAKFFSRAGLELDPAGTYEHRQPFELGPFRVTPFLNDHSGFDTHSMLIEADDRRLFYSADFQGHGRKKAIFEEMLRKPPRDVDVMLMEGTNLRHDIDEPETTTEDDVEASLVEVFRQTSGLVLITYSAQNIDRLVTIYRAAKQTQRTLVVDLYVATVASATEREKIPKPGFPCLKVMVPHRQRVQVKEAQEFERLKPITDHRIYAEALAQRPSGFVVTFGSGLGWELEKANCLAGAAAVWSLWPGYLERGGEKPYLDFLERNSIRPLHKIHASGHAYLTDLKRMATALSPKRLVPIHSSARDRFVDHFDNVELHEDGEWWEV